MSFSLLDSIKWDRVVIKSFLSKDLPSDENTTAS